MTGHHSIVFFLCVLLCADDNGAVVKGQWNVDSVDPVGGNKGVMMKMLTGMLEIQHHRFAR